MLINDKEYLKAVDEVKKEIQVARYKASVAVNSELVILYYLIGQIINKNKVWGNHWGNQFIDNLAREIKMTYPELKGYSARNLKYMAKFALTYSDEKFVQTVSAQIPWSHNIAIIEATNSKEERIWYINKTIENGWSHSVLVHQLESGLYNRQTVNDKINNFDTILSSAQSELAVQTMKDPYIFDFIAFKNDMIEHDIEQVLTKNITKLLLELGTGFAFLGNQYYLNVGGDDFYIDLMA